MFETVMDTKEEIQHEAGTIVPIRNGESIRKGEVSVEAKNWYNGRCSIALTR